MLSLKNYALATALTLTVAAVAARPADAAEDLSDFSLTGTVTKVWCSRAPEPPAAPCYLELEIDAGEDEPAKVDVWCRGAIADVCEDLPYGLRVIIIGIDTIVEKQVSHLGMLLEPDD